MRICLLIFLVSLSVTIQAANSPATRRIQLKFEKKPRYNLVNLPYRFPRKIKVGLVLSGGGARGFAHIGVLKAFVEQNIPIDLIVGSSMGSVVGGFYCAGYSPDQLTELIKKVKWNDIFNDETYRTNLFWSQKTIPRRHVLEMRFDKGIPYIPSAISAGQKIFDIIYSKLLKANFQAANDFDNLRIPFRCVTTDLISGKSVVLKNGDLAEAISASMAVPLLFSPVETEGMWLVDGGIRDNLPVDVALRNKTDLVIAVDVTSPLRNANQMRSPWQVADQVSTIMMQEPTRESRKLADILIKPPVGKLGAGDFSQIDSAIKIGYRSALDQIDRIKQMIEREQENLWGKNRKLGKVTEVIINGLQETGLDTLARDMRTQSGYVATTYAIYHDLYRFYDSGCISDISAVIKCDSADCTVEFFLKENPVVKKLKFESVSLFPDSVLQQKVNIPLDMPLNYKNLVNGIDSLQNFYIENGYSLAKILRTEYDPQENSLTFHFREGKITSLEVTGNRTTNRSVILREFPLKVGQIFKADLATRGIRNIHSTGLFDKVTSNVVPKGEGYQLNIKVKEKKYLLMRFGGYASLERKSQASLEFAEDNLFGRDVKVSLWGAIGDLQKQAEFKLYSVRLFNTLLTYRISLYYRERWDRYYHNFVRRGEYLTIRRGVRFILGQQIARLGSITGELRWDNVNIFSGAAEFPFRDKYRIRSISFRSVVDKRDKLPFPDSGIYNRWVWETGNRRILAGSVAFTRFNLALEGYYPFSKSFNYHIRFNIGSADLTLPFSEYFTLGGMLEFPGLREHELFGRQIFFLKNEFRYQMPWRYPIDLYLGINYQIGATWQTSEDTIRKSDFLTSVGAYIAVNSILGPIRFAYGNLTNKRHVYYFSVGYYF